MRQLFTIFYMSTFLLLTSGCVKHELEDSYSSGREVRKVIVNVDSADVVIKPSRGERSEVDIDMTYRGNEPDYDMSINGTTLKVKVPCPFMCDGTVTVRVPEDVRVKASLDSGDLNVSDMDGPAVLNVDSGNLRVENLSGDLELDADSGSIKGEVSSAVCYADVDSGNINLRFAEKPEEIDVGADSGNIKLYVPKGTYRVSTRVDSGDADVDNLDLDDDADRTIRTDVDSGNIDIIGY